MHLHPTRCGCGGAVVIVGRDSCTGRFVALRPVQEHLQTFANVWLLVFVVLSPAGDTDTCEAIPSFVFWCFRCVGGSSIIIWIVGGMFLDV